MRTQMDELLNCILPLAHQLVAKRGGFLPFGASIPPGGLAQLVAVHTGEEHPASHELIARFRQIFAEEASASKIEACAIAYDAKITLPPGQTSDAIIVDSETVTDHARVVQPYSRRPLRSLRFGDLIRAPYEPVIFGAAGDTIDDMPE